MDNIDFLQKILMSEAEYWIVAKADEYYHGKGARNPDDIIFIAIPRGTRRGLKYEDILLQDIEKLKSAPIDTNVFLNSDYAPFQIGQTLYSVYQGFPIETSIRRVFEQVLSVKYDSLYKYQELYDLIADEVKSKTETPTLQPAQQ